MASITWHHHRPGLAVNGLVGRNHNTSGCSPAWNCFQLHSDRFTADLVCKGSHGAHHLEPWGDLQVETPVIRSSPRLACSDRTSGLVCHRCSSDCERLISAGWLLKPQACLLGPRSVKHCSAAWVPLNTHTHTEASDSDKAFACAWDCKTVDNNRDSVVYFQELHVTERARCWIRFQLIPARLYKCHSFLSAIVGEGKRVCLGWKMTRPDCTGVCLVNSISSCCYPSASAGAAWRLRQLQKQPGEHREVLKGKCLKQARSVASSRRAAARPSDPRFLHERMKKNLFWSDPPQRGQQHCRQTSTCQDLLALSLWCLHVRTS